MFHMLSIEIQVCKEGKVRPWNSLPTAVTHLGDIDLVIDVCDNKEIHHIPDHTGLEDHMNILGHTSLEGMDHMNIHGHTSLEGMDHVNTHGHIHGRIDLIHDPGQSLDLNQITRDLILVSVKGGGRDALPRTEPMTNEGTGYEKTENY